MLASLFCAYDIGSPSFLGSNIIGIIDPAIGVNIVLAIPFAFAVAFPFPFAFPFPVALASLAALAPLPAPIKSPYKVAL